MDAVVADAKLLFIFPARFLDALLESMAQVAAEGLTVGPYGEDSQESPVGAVDSSGSTSFARRGSSPFRIEFAYLEFKAPSRPS